MRALLRLSWREVRRARGRSALIMAMIGLPVLVITLLLTLFETTAVDDLEGLTARIGAADALVRTTESRGPIEQSASGNWVPKGQLATAPPWEQEAVAAAVGLGARLTPFNTGTVEVLRGRGYDPADVLETDLRDALTAGVRPLLEGRYATTPGEVVVTRALGVRIGDTIEVTRGNRQVRVVGVVQNPIRPTAVEVIGMPGVLLLDHADGHGTGWLADTAQPVTWAQVQRINRVGLAVRSRSVLENTPDSIDTAYGRVDDLVSAGVAVIMVVLETVLLAGPAFAVGMRRRRHELAMIAAQGGSPYHLRAIVLADGLVLGGSAAILAAALGIGLGLVIAPVLAQWEGSIGPPDVPWPSVLGVAALGLVSALIAALVPAVQAARQPASVVLAGRSPELHARAGKPRLGLALVVAGLVATYFTLRDRAAWVMAAAVLVQLGLVALMPWLVQASGRLAARLPLPARLSVRDAARHRIRTASAAAAVMAATASVVAISISVYTNEVDNRDHYYPGMPVGTTAIGSFARNDTAWAKVKARAGEVFPGVSFAEARKPIDAAGRAFGLRFTGGDCGGRCLGGATIAGDLPIGDQRLLRILQRRDDPVAAAALAQGKSVVFDRRLLRNGTVELGMISYGDSKPPEHTIRVPAVFAEPGDPHQGGGVLARQGVEQAGLKTAERALYAAHRPAGEELALERDLQAVAGTDLYLEKGYHGNAVPRLWIMLAGALILVVGGTLVATRLAAADLRPEQEILAAIGAMPMTRRMVLAVQAGYIAGLGALVGVAAGGVTGLALTWPMTGPAIVAVPWLFVAAVVLGLPLLAALAAGVFTRTGGSVRTRRLT